MAPPNGRFPVIAGPTAGGKSDLAVDVVLAFGGGEVISADSVQIFRGMDVGSGKITPAERRGVPHHLIDVVEPAEAFTVSNWLGRANAIVSEIQGRGRTPVVVGGTHLYIKAFLEGLFEGPEPDEALREELRGQGLVKLRAELERVDPQAAARIHPNDERRTVRALEVFRHTGKPISEHQKQWDRGARADCVLVGIEWPVEELNRRINARVKAMMEAGLLEEVRGFWGEGRLGVQAREALGYRQLVEHLEGRCTLDEAVEQIKIETRRFAKQQRTWIRRLKTIPGAVWIDAASVPRDQWVEVVASACQPPS